MKKVLAITAILFVSGVLIAFMILDDGNGSIKEEIAENYGISSADPGEMIYEYEPTEGAGPFGEEDELYVFLIKEDCMDKLCADLDGNENANIIDDSVVQWLRLARHNRSRLKKDENWKMSDIESGWYIMYDYDNGKVLDGNQIERYCNNELEMANYGFLLIDSDNQRLYLWKLHY